MRTPPMGALARALGDRRIKICSLHRSRGRPSSGARGDVPAGAQAGRFPHFCGKIRAGLVGALPSY